MKVTLTVEVGDNLKVNPFTLQAWLAQVDAVGIASTMNAMHAASASYTFSDDKDHLSV